MSTYLNESALDAELQLAEAVAEGAAFMDAIDVNVTDDAERWFWVVDPERLRMHHNGGPRAKYGCITAQHHPDGYANFMDYGSIYFDDRLKVAFNVVGVDDPTAESSTLTALWREEIVERRAAWFDAHPEATAP